MAYKRLSKEERALQKKERLEHIYSSIEEEVMYLIKNPQELRDLMVKYKSEEWGETTKGNTYSFGNFISASYECRIRFGISLQYIAPASVWKKKYKRYPKKGSKAIYITGYSKSKPKTIVEVNEKTGEEEELIDISSIRTFYPPVPVFDYSQTQGFEGSTRPEIFDKSELYSSFEDYKIDYFIKRCEFPVEFKDLLKTWGYTDGESITINSNQSELSMICTLLHEYAHAMLHFDSNREHLSRELKEFQAECTAYIVSSYLNIDNKYSREYIASWISQNEDVEREFKKNCNKIVSVASEMIKVFK